MSYYYYFAETEGMGYGQWVAEMEARVHACRGPSIFIRGGFSNLSGEGGHQ